MTFYNFLQIDTTNRSNNQRITVFLLTNERVSRDFITITRVPRDWLRIFRRLSTGRHQPSTLIREQMAHIGLMPLRRLILGNINLIVVTMRVTHCIRRIRRNLLRGQWPRVPSVLEMLDADARDCPCEHCIQVIHVVED